MQSLKRIFYEDFSSLSSVISNEGLPEGSPVFRDGLILDGSSYISYNIPNTLLAKPKLSIVVEFIPDFESDVSTGHVFWDTTVGDTRTLLYKSTTNDILFYAGGSIVASIVNATYKPYWNVGQRNVIVVAMESGSSNIWLNGNQILTNDSTTYSNMYATELYIGANSVGSSEFDGTIKSFSIHNRLFTSDEAQAVYDNSLFNFQNKADVWLDMKSQTSDGTNQITEDKSSNGNHFLLGDGTTDSTFPAFSAPGFDFDGSTDYMLNDSASGIYNNTEQSIVIAFKPDFDSDANVTHYLFDSTGSDYRLLKVNNASSNTLRPYLGSTAISFISESAYGPYWQAHGVNVIVLAGTTGNTSLYLNGVKVLDSANTAWTPADPTEIYIGQAYNGTQRYIGEIFHFSTYPFKLSPIQAEHITGQLIAEYR